MFNRKTDHALNKTEAIAIIYQDANGNIIRLTVQDFSSPKEFRKWKNWTQMKNHAEEKNNHRYRNHTVCLDDLTGCIPATSGMEEETAAKEAAQEYAYKRQALFHQVKALLTPTQFRRMWMYHIEKMDTYEIAAMEGTCHQAISQSLAAAEKKIASKLKKA